MPELELAHPAEPEPECLPELKAELRAGSGLIDGLERKPIHQPESDQFLVREAVYLPGLELSHPPEPELECLPEPKADLWAGPGLIDGLERKPIHQPESDQFLAREAVYLPGLELSHPPEPKLECLPEPKADLWAGLGLIDAVEQNLVHQSEPDQFLAQEAV